MRKFAVRWWKEWPGLECVDGADTSEHSHRVGVLSFGLCWNCIMGVKKIRYTRVNGKPAW